ncbi:MAG: hypothetical protein ACP5XB_24285 [Isosphaeraceae bacterium]
MVDLTILAMTEDESWLASFWSEARRLKKTRVVATRSMDEACDLLDCAGTQLLVLDCRSSSFTLDDLDRLLWTNSTRAHPARVLVIDETYRPEVALDLFRMGVDDYVCSSDHGLRLSTIVRHLLGEAGEREIDVVPATLALSRNPQPPPHLPTRLVAAAMA